MPNEDLLRLAAADSWERVAMPLPGDREFQDRLRPFDDLAGPKDFSYRTTDKNGNPVYKKQFHNVGDDIRQKNELLGSLVHRAIGSNAARVVRYPGSDSAMAVEWNSNLRSPDWDDEGNYGVDYTIDSPHGVLAGLGDTLTGEGDRHENNWDEDIKRKVPYVYDFSGGNHETVKDEEGRFYPFANHVYSDFGHHFVEPNVDDKHFGWHLIQNPLHPTKDVPRLEAALQALEPDYEAEGALDRHTELMRRWHEVASHAGGTESVLERAGITLPHESGMEHEAAAKKKPKPKKPRKPEEVWYDVHKHPEGTPGGMGKSPEHHLRRRGWNGHEINEAGGRKTIQYRNHDFPDFVISYGGGTSQKPDHNFRVLYMGTNRNIPKVHHVYSVAEAMNKVEELQKLDSGLVVQPMTAHQASADEPWETIPNYKGDLPAGMQDWNWEKFHNNIWLDGGYDHALMTPQEAGRLQRENEAAHRAGTHDHIFEVNWAPYKGGMVRTKKVDRGEWEAAQKKFWDREARRGYWDDGNVFHEYYDHNEKPCFNCGEIHDRPLTSEAAAPIATAPTVAQLPKVKQPKTFKAPARPATRPDMNDDPNDPPIGPPDFKIPSADPAADWPKKQKPQLQEIPALPKPKPQKYTAALLELAGQPTWDFQKLALGDLTYGPGHPREGELMDDEDAHQYLLSGRHQIVKEVPTGVDREEHNQVMYRLREMVPSEYLGYTLHDPAQGVGSHQKIWLRKNQSEPVSWSAGWDDENGHHGGYLINRARLNDAIDAVEDAGLHRGWLS